jgi:hypothetical protein
MTKRIEMEGRRFIRLVVVGIARRNRHGQIHYRCKCDCGAEVEVLGESLRNGRTGSCGCYHRDIATLHGQWNSPEYSIWAGMRERCSNPNSRAYRWYGALGVAVHPRWEDFTTFFKDMGERPTRKHSIDRINPFGDYEPGNCRWATPTEQARNKRAPHIRRFCSV